MNNAVLQASETGTIAAPWRACVMVCATCAAKRPDGVLPDGRTEARAWLHQRLRDAGSARAVRVAETSCLGVCPPNGVTALIVPANGRGRAEAMVLLGPDQRERALRAAVAAAGDQ